MAFNHFDYVPSSVTDDRSGFKFKKAISKGIQLGWLYPICKPVNMLPGSSLTLDIAMEIRSGALIAPLMDELHLDLFAFNVPNRIVWEHWKQFLGATDDVLFDNLTEYQIPSFKYGLGVYEGDSVQGMDAQFTPTMVNYQWNQCLACHFELPFPTIYGTYAAPYTYDDKDVVKISALPFRGYDFIYNEYFLPEYIGNHVLFSKGDQGYQGDNMTIDVSLSGNNYDHFNGTITPEPAALASDVPTVGGCVMPVYRAHRSLWTSCLPKPSLETLNLLGGLSNLPVGAILTADIGASPVNGNVTSSASPSTPAGTFIKAKSPFYNAAHTELAPLIADVSNAILTVNNYRETILLQNYYDALNRAGSRYDEILANLFHTRTAMAVISIPELIVHKRFTIYRKDVISTAQTNNGASNVKPLGSQGAYIDTVIRDNFFTKSTTEHGYIHMLMCVRPAFIRMTSGIEPDWTVLSKLDLFYPQFQGMGDVPRKKMEVAYFSPSGVVQSSILGYQEYSAEYKYFKNTAVGWLDPHTPNSIKGYNINDEHLVANFVGINQYYLSCFSEEVSFANCLAVPDPKLAPQFVCDIRLDGTIYHPMKVYNIPGQADLL